MWSDERCIKKMFVMKVLPVCVLASRVATPQQVRKVVFQLFDLVVSNNRIPD